MAIDQVVAPLLRVPLFSDLKPLQITEIARHAERIKFRRGAVIIEAGTLGDGAFLIVSGDAERRPDPGSLAPPEPIEPGSLVGELAMLVDHVYGSTVVAVGRVHCLKITRAALHDQMREDPPLAQHVASRISSRLTQVAAELRRIDQMLGLRPETPPVSLASSQEEAPSPALSGATGTQG
jgi:CRP/FNR family transcriptional regulator, cyclic AMP receptor protein